jgi:hypothetical protein
MGRRLLALLISFGLISAQAQSVDLDEYRIKANMRSLVGTYAGEDLSSGEWILATVSLEEGKLKYRTLIGDKVEGFDLELKNFDQGQGKVESTGKYLTNTITRIGPSKKQVEIRTIALHEDELSVSLSRAYFKKKFDVFGGEWVQETTSVEARRNSVYAFQNFNKTSPRPLPEGLLKSMAAGREKPIKSAEIVDMRAYRSGTCLKIFAPR